MSQTKQDDLFSSILPIAYDALVKNAKERALSDEETRILGDICDFILEAPRAVQ